MVYAKLIDGKIEFPPKNKGRIINYNLSKDLLIKDGYKVFNEAEKVVNDRYYKLIYREDENNIFEYVEFLETEAEYLKRKENEQIQVEINSLESKIKEIDFKRIRAICEPENKDEKTGKTWLEYYNTQIFDLRKKLQELKERLEENEITVE